MKGIVFNLLEETISAEFGEDTWDALLEAAHLNGVYTSLGSYSDAELMTLVAAAANLLDMPAADVVRWFGRKAMPQFAARYPSFFEGHASTRSFLLTLNEIIHPEVRKLYPGADVPEFDFDSSDPDVLVMGYVSHRKMCAFAVGLIEGAAAHFGEEVDIHHITCMNNGDAKCLLRIAPRLGSMVAS